MALADMAGALFVADVERGGSTVKRMADPETFLELPFEQAVQFFENRFADQDRATEIIRKYRDRSSGASERTLQRIAKQMIAKLDATLQEGGTLAEFVSEFEGRRVGGEVLEAGYLENVYRTNIQTAYGAGRVSEIEQVSDSVAYVEYVTVGDDRVRDSHAALDGKVWRANDPDWRRFAPPNGYQCRCAIVTRDEGEIDTRQLKRPADSTGISADFLRSPSDLVQEPL